MPRSNSAGRRTIIRNQIATALAQASAATLKQQVFARNRRKAKGALRPSTIAIYASVFALIIAVIAVSYKPPQQVTTTVANAVADTSTTANSTDQTSVDTVVASSLAANLAQSTNLPVAAQAANSALSAQITSEITPSDTTTLSKPDIIQPTSKNRSVINYVTQAGDTVASVAAKYTISPTTIDWANNLTSDTLPAGKTLQILPIDGVLYTVKAGDTAASLASTYGVDATRLVTYNDLDISGLVPGTQIILPGGTLPTDQRPGYVAPRTTNYYTYTTTAYGYSNGNLTVVNPYSYISVSIYSNRVDAGNKNYNGQCTWYAWERRSALGIPLPSIVLGNASSWSYTLGAAGYAVNSTPSVGAVIQNGGGAGHVGVVEKVNSDGSIVISEMNNAAAGGPFVVDVRTIPSYAVGYFNYIH